jgi:hypothetical protein
MLAVLALHAALLGAILKWRGGIIVAKPGRPLEVSFLPAKPPRDRLEHAPPQGLRDTPPRPPLDLPTPLPRSAGEADGGPWVNWEEEAHRAADAHANESSMQTPNYDSPPSAGSSWFPPPAHHAGDEIHLGGGETMVFTSSRCYQIVKAIPMITNGINNGLGSPTYCIPSAKEPRGDLFKDLRAYKKLHPEK